MRLFATALILIALVPAHAAAKKRSAKPVIARPSAIDQALAAALMKAPKQEQYPDHDSAMLLDLGRIVIKPDGTTVSEFRETHKLFNERARDRAEVSFGYSASYETIDIVQARTVRKDGRVQDVKPSEIRRESGFQEFALYDDSKTVGFSLPGIEDDCVIDYTYRKTSKPMMPGHFMEHWTFTGFEPSLHSRLEVQAPASLKLEFKLHNGDLQPTMTTSPDGKAMTYLWEMRDIKPVESEPDMPPMSEVTMWLEISNGAQWQDLARWFWSLAKPQFVATAPIRATVEKLIAGKQTDEEKAAALYDFVTKRVRYVGLEFGVSAFKPHAAAQVHEKLYGDCKDKTGLLITMLGVVGIKAYPVLLDTSLQSKPGEQLPSIGAFDHCIALAEIGGKRLWLDGTAETTPYGEIPAGDRGSEGFVIRDGVGTFETIPKFSPAENGGSVKMTFALRADGGAELEIDTAMMGYLAEGMRASLQALPAQKVKEVMQQMAQAFGRGVTLKDYKLPDFNAAAGEKSLKLSLSAKEWSKRVGGLLLVPLSTGSSRFIGRSPYTKETRRWPIVMDEATRFGYELVVTLPDGYAVEESPTDSDLSNALVKFKRTVAKSADGNSLTLRGSFETREGRLPASDYAAVKALFDAIFKANEEQLVLRRK